MKLRECYDAFGGSYEEAAEHIPGEALIRRLVIKFLSDKSYERLQKSLQEENYEEAFRAAHTLKGVCLNMSFKKLASSSSKLTDQLRKYETEPIDKASCLSLWEQVSKDYAEVTEAVRRLQEEAE